MARLALRPDDLVERAAGVPLEAEAQPLEPEAQRTAAQAAAFRLLYPLLRWLLVKAWDRGAAAGIAACSLLASSWLVTIVTLIAVWAAHGFTFPTDRQHDMEYYWPPANVGDFCLGVAAAALLQPAPRHRTGGRVH